MASIEIRLRAKGQSSGPTKDELAQIQTLIEEAQIPDLSYQANTRTSIVYTVEQVDSVSAAMAKLGGLLSSGVGVMASVDWAVRVADDFGTLTNWGLGVGKAQIAIHPGTFRRLPASDRANYFEEPRLNACLPFRGEAVCFVVSPIGEDDSETRQDADLVFERYVKPACGRTGYRPERGDQLPGDRISHGVISSLSASPLVLAYVGDGAKGWNPNVMLEIGYRLGTGSRIVFLQRGAAPLPFDLHDYRVVRIPETEDGAAVDRTVGDLESKILERRGTEDRTAYSHAIARIDIPKEDAKGRARAVFVAESDEAAQLFGVRRAEETDLGEVMGLLVKNLAESQRKPFVDEQQRLQGELARGGLPVATRPIVFRGHESSMAPRLAHLPIVFQRTELVGKTRLRVLYLDVTKATQCDREGYLCELGLPSNRWLEELQRLTRQVQMSDLDRQKAEFERYAAGYDVILPKLAFYREVLERHLSVLRVPEVACVADLGAGTGAITVPLLEDGKEVLAVDIATAMLTRLRSKVEALNRMDRVTIVEHSIEQLGSIAPDWFDAVNLLLVLWSVVNPEQALAEALRILKPGGRIVLTEPKRQFNLRQLLERAEQLVKGLPGWPELRADWEVVKRANEALLDEQWLKSRPPRLYAEDIEQRLRDARFEVRPSEDSHYGNCATIVAFKPK